MRFGAFFSPIPHATVVFFARFSPKPSDGHTTRLRTRKTAVFGRSKVSYRYRAGSGKKDGAQSVRQSQAPVNIYGHSISRISRSIRAGPACCTPTPAILAPVYPAASGSARARGRLGSGSFGTGTELAYPHRTGFRRRLQVGFRPVSDRSHSPISAVVVHITVSSPPGDTVHVIMSHV